MGNGGNILIDTTFVLASDMSNISAQAVSGQGGNIGITATELFVTPSSQISASSDLGVDGKVNIQTFNSAERNNLIKLPEKTIQADNLIIQSCGDTKGKSKFINTGKGGLPTNLLTEILDNNAIADLENFKLESFKNSLNGNLSDTVNSQTNSRSPMVIEAESWQLNSQGEVELVAVDNSNPHSLRFPHASCF